METAALIGLVLFIISEILPFTKFKGNGIAQQLIEAARELYPHTPRK